MNSNWLRVTLVVLVPKKKKKACLCHLTRFFQELQLSYIQGVIWIICKVSKLWLWEGRANSGLQDYRGNLGLGSLKLELLNYNYYRTMVLWTLSAVCL